MAVHLEVHGPCTSRTSPEALGQTLVVWHSTLKGCQFMAYLPGGCDPAILASELDRAGDVGIVLGAARREGSLIRAFERMRVWR